MKDPIPNTSLEPTGVGAVSSAARFTSQVAGGSVLGRWRRMNTKAQKYFSITGFSPLRVAYILSIFTIALVPTDFSDDCYRFTGAIANGALVLFVFVVLFCILAPQNTHRRFLPAALAFFGLIALIICAPL
jgi:hypothetical protein